MAMQNGVFGGVDARRGAKETESKQETLRQDVYAHLRSRMEWRVEARRETQTVMVPPIAAVRWHNYGHRLPSIE